MGRLVAELTHKLRTGQLRSTVAPVHPIIAAKEEAAKNMPAEQKQIVSREIAFFRERTAERDRVLEERERDARRRREENERAARERFEMGKLQDSHDEDMKPFAYESILRDEDLIEEEDIEKRIREEKERDYQEVCICSSSNNDL